MLNFKILGVPVQVQPIFWLMAFVIGGGFGIEPNREGFIAILLSMAVIFLSVLVHEFGHALTSRKLTDVNPSVSLVAMGGLATPNTHLTNKQSFWVTWAGPLAGFGLFLITLLGLIFVYGPSSGLHFTFAYIIPGIDPDQRFLEVALHMNRFALVAVTMLLFANFWWSVINLLPIFPLDGGQIYAAVEPSQIKVVTVGMVTGIIAAVAFLIFGRLIGAVLFGFLAYENYQRLQQMKGGYR